MDPYRQVVLTNEDEELLLDRRWITQLSSVLADASLIQETSSDIKLTVSILRTANENNILCTILSANNSHEFNVTTLLPKQPMMNFIHFICHPLSLDTPYDTVLMLTLAALKLKIKMNYEPPIRSLVHALDTLTDSQLITLHSSNVYVHRFIQQAHKRWQVTIPNLPEIMLIQMEMMAPLDARTHYRFVRFNQYPQTPHITWSPRCVGSYDTHLEIRYMQPHRRTIIVDKATIYFYLPHSFSYGCVDNTLIQLMFIPRMDTIRGLSVGEDFRLYVLTNHNVFISNKPFEVQKISCVTMLPLKCTHLAIKHMCPMTHKGFHYLLIKTADCFVLYNISDNALVCNYPISRRAVFTQIDLNDISHLYMTTESGTLEFDFRNMTFNECAALFPKEYSINPLVFNCKQMEKSSFCNHLLGRT